MDVDIYTIELGKEFVWIGMVMRSNYVIIVNKLMFTFWFKGWMSRFISLLKMFHDKE